MKTFISLQKGTTKHRQTVGDRPQRQNESTLKEVLKVEIPNCCLRQSHLINVKTKKVLVVFKSKDTELKV